MIAPILVDIMEKNVQYKSCYTSVWFAIMYWKEGTQYTIQYPLFQHQQLAFYRMSTVSAE